MNDTIIRQALLNEAERLEAHYAAYERRRATLDLTDPQAIARFADEEAAALELEIEAMQGRIAALRRRAA